MKTILLFLLIISIIGILIAGFSLFFLLNVPTIKDNFGRRLFMIDGASFHDYDKTLWRIIFGLTICASYVVSYFIF